MMMAKQAEEAFALQDEEEHIYRSQYPAVPVPSNLTLPEFVLQDADSFSDKVAIVDAVTGKSFTYGQLLRDTRRFAKALIRSLGLRRAQVVVVALPNVVEYATVALGIMSAGGVFSGANPQAHATEIQKQAQNAEAKLIVTTATFYDMVKGLNLPTIVVGEDYVSGTIHWNDLLAAAECGGTEEFDDAVNQNDLCALPYSSGTTGTSKGVMLTHRNLVANLCSTLFSVSPDMVGQFTTLGLMPFFHIYGTVGICCSTLRNKGKIVVMGRFELKAFLSALIKHEVNFAPIVPPIMLALVKNPIVDEFDIQQLKLKAVMTAAAPLAPDLLRAFEEKFPGVQLQETQADLSQGTHLVNSAFEARV
ncbi:4-coumarate--CoA ligase-like 1 [Asimina triloba]